VSIALGPRIVRGVPVYVGAAALTLWALTPIVWVAISSLSDRIELYAVPYKHWIPEHPTFDNYIELFTSGPQYRGATVLPGRELLLLGLRNSTILAVGSAVVICLLSLLAGYAFSRLQFRGKQTMFIALVALVPLPIWVSLTSLYFMLSQIGLNDSLVGMMLLFVAYGLPLYIWLMQTYIDSVPRELEEAAFIDGASPIRALFAVVLPVAMPGLTSVFLVAFLTTWNNFLIPVIFSNTMQSQPLTVVMNLFIGQYEVVWESMSAAAMFILLPPALLALFFQRYLVRGLAVGGVK
jgi:multiple sugar transport system permease protein